MVHMACVVTDRIALEQRLSQHLNQHDVMQVPDDEEETTPPQTHAQKARSERQRTSVVKRAQTDLPAHATTMVLPCFTTTQHACMSHLSRYIFHPLPV